MDIFDTKGIKPMLISEMKDAFDDSNYIYELKLDGIRCIAYLDKEGTDLRNKRDMKLLPRVPELFEINKCVKEKCILDGELVILKDGKPDFYELQRRSLLSDAFKIKLAANKHPASFVVYDIIYYKDKQVNELPLLERKKLIDEIVSIENNSFAVSRYIEESGTLLFKLAKQQQLEGIVAKKKDSKYWFDKRSKDWIKCKVMSDDDFVICGYVLKQNNMISLICGQYDGEKLIYSGSVAMGASLRILNQYSYQLNDYPTIEELKDRDDIVWMKPTLVCIIEYMPSDKEYMRQPVLKAIRDDKLAKECTVK